MQMVLNLVVVSVEDAVGWAAIHTLLELRLGVFVVQNLQSPKTQNCCQHGSPMGICFVPQTPCSLPGSFWDMFSKF